MKPIAVIAAVLSGLAACACDVFIADVGHEGEPCSKFNHECYGALICIQGTCSTPSELGGPCDWDELYNEAQCVDGLWCGVDETCIEAGALNEPCRIDPYGQICNGGYDIQPCDGELICRVTMIEDSSYYDEIYVGECVDLDAATGAGDACLCDESWTEPELCLFVCDPWLDPADGYCADGLTCDEVTGLCE